MNRYKSTETLVGVLRKCQRERESRINLRRCHSESLNQSVNRTLAAMQASLKDALWLFLSFPPWLFLWLFLYFALCTRVSSAQTVNTAKNFVHTDYRTLCDALLEIHWSRFFFDGLLS